MEAIIHYIKSGRSFGPVTVQDFLNLLETKVISVDDQVRVEGDGRWRSAGEMADLIRSGRLPVTRTSKKPSVIPTGGYTVFTSAPPIIPRAPLPRELLPMATCAACGTPASDSARFCKHCGVSLMPQRCGACQQDNDPDAHFCERCGHKLLAPVTL